MKDRHPSSRNLTRRGFLGSSLAAVSAAGLHPESLSAQAPKPPENEPRIKEFRTLGRTGFRVSDISFGAGNLTNPNVLVAALDRGVNYIDTAEHYVNGGSERSIGQALKGRNRKSFFLTTKLGLWRPEVSKPELKDRFKKCLERLQVDYVDCLMIHMCSLANLKHEPYHELIRELKAEGRVRFTGLSNHGADLGLYGRLDDPMDKVVLAAAEDGRFDVVLFAYNYLKTEMGERILAACKAKNMGATLMKMDPSIYIDQDKEIIRNTEKRYKDRNQEPPEGFKTLAKLAEERAEKTQAFLKKYGLQGPEQARAAAIKFCLNHPGVHCVCPTINAFEEMEAFVALSGQRIKLLEKAMLADLSDLTGEFYCRHACGECEPACPQGLPINTIMRYDYYFKAKGQEKHALVQYAALNGRDAGACSGCAGPCMAACPHGVPIQGKLILAHETLSSCILVLS